MGDVRLVSFIADKEDLFASLISISAINHVGELSSKPVIIIATDVLEEFQKEHPETPLDKIYNKLGAELVVAFPKGYNWNLGFRPAVKNMVRNVQKGESMLYFSPRIIFFSLNVMENCGEQFWAASQSDNFWPKKELYGPTLEKMWSVVAELGGQELEGWLNLDAPKEYWRRFPAASPDLFYAPDPKKFEDIYSQINDQLIKAPPHSLAGQGHAPREAAITATMFQLNGKIVHPGWDENLLYYQDFYEMMLRLSDEQAEWMNETVFDDAVIRPVLKGNDEYKTIFYQDTLSKVRESLESAKRNFSSTQMQMLIGRRNLRKRIRNQIKRRKQKQNNPPSA